MSKFIIQPHGRLNDWVADEKGYFIEEGLDYELNVAGSRKNTPRLAAVDSPIPLDDNRFGAFERYAEGHGQPFTRAVVVRLPGILPEVPIDRQQPEPDGGEVLLHLEEALRLPEARLLDRNADVDSILGIEPRAEGESHDPQDADRCSVARALYRAEARDETRSAYRLPHRYEHRHRLVRERTQKRDRQQSMDNQQDRPERVDGYVVEHEVHRGLLSSSRVWFG